jgi:hypothetical protein
MSAKDTEQMSGVFGRDDQQKDRRMVNSNPECILLQISSRATCILNNDSAVDPRVRIKTFPT